MVLLELTAEYFTMALAAVLGVLQASAAYAGRYKMCFFNRSIHAYLFCALTTGPAMAGFFTWNWRNATGLVEGTQQFMYFTLAAACAVGLSLLLSWSVRHAGLQVPHYRLIRRLPRTVNVREKGGLGD
jgi:hypothetical protein